MKKYLFAVVVCFALLQSCKHKSSAVIKSFHDVPIEMQEGGAGCLFAVDMKKYDKGEYLMATNYDSIAYVVINGQMTRFVLVEAENNESTLDVKQIFKSGDYTLRLNMKHTAGMDETNDYKGEMAIEDKDGKIISKKLVGICGA
jgi:hypothetical protein